MKLTCNGMESGISGTHFRIIVNMGHLRCTTIDIYAAQENIGLQYCRDKEVIKFRGLLLVCMLSSKLECVGMKSLVCWPRS